MPDPSIKKLADMSQVPTICQQIDNKPPGLQDALADCEIYLKGVEVLTEIKQAQDFLQLCRVEIYRILKNGVEVTFYPPIHKKIVDVPLDSLRLPTSQQAELLDSWDMFYGLKRWDKVVLNDNNLLKTFFGDTAVANARRTDLVMLLVKDTSRRTLEGLVEVQLRSVVDLIDADKLSRHALFKLKTEMTANGLPAPVKFMVRRTDIRNATAKDEWNSSRGRSLYDRLAIWYPAYFLAKIANYDWDTVRRLCKQDDLTFNFGGMDAMLEYRGWLCEYALERVADFTFLKSRIDRTVLAMDKAVGPIVDGPLPPAATQAFQDPVLTAVQNFINGAKKMGWAAPGSSEATSDVDLSTFNDGTEWAAKLFNFLFSELHGGAESGISFDVNIYAGGFIPDNWDAYKVRQKGNPKNFQVPTYLYPIGDPRQGELDEAQQEIASLLHMRRYLEPAGNVNPWQDFLDGVLGLASVIQGADPTTFRTRTAAVELAYWQNRYQLADKIRFLVNSGQSGVDRTQDAFAGYRPDVPQTNNHQQDLLQYRNLIENHALPRNVRMACENRLYEARLSTVADLKLQYSYRQAMADGQPDAEDRTCLNLRTVMSDSLYFGNECYASEGALLQVVGGKQFISAGVGVDKKGGLTFHNIRYTKHQLVQSMNEQLGDFFKESNRHFKHAMEQGEHDDEAFGGSVVAGGKYLHRYFNALKFFYLILDGRFEGLGSFRIQLTGDPAALNVDSVFSCLGNPDTKGTPGFMKSLNAINALSQIQAMKAPNYARQWHAFESFRRAMGFGLEMLKKFDFKDQAKPNPDPVVVPDPNAPNADLNPGPQGPLTTYLDVLNYKLGMTLDAGFQYSNSIKPTLARAVVGNYMRYVILPLGIDPGRDLASFQAALVRLHGLVTADYYFEQQAEHQFVPAE